MSYPNIDTGNSLNDYFSRLIDFVQLAPHLLAAKDERTFQIWLEKLEPIDRRALLRYLRQNKDKIPASHFQAAQYRFAQDI